MGVRRAVKIACNQLACNHAENPAGKVYTLGPLIHNPQALEDLKQRGIEILDENKLPENLSGAVVIIRAHGISPQTEAELRGRGAVVVDATCPKVKASQLKAASLAKQGYSFFLAGEESHAEIAGINGYAEEGWLHRNDDDGNGRFLHIVTYTNRVSKTRIHCIPGRKRFLQVVSCTEEAETAAKLLSEDPELHNPKTALIAQTTISSEEYHAIGMVISRYFPTLEIIQTICAATKERQDSLRELLGKVDAVAIGGGKDSANTRRLLAIAQASGKPCAIVETAKDIPPDFFKFETVGLAAGASTPDTVIDAIEQTLKK